MVRLFVSFHRHKEILCSESIRQRAVNAKLLDNSPMQRNSIVVDATKPPGEERSKNHSYGHCFAVAQFSDSSTQSLRSSLEPCSFDGMRQGMPVVQDHAAPTLTLVSSNYGGFDGNAASNLLRQTQAQDLI